MWSAGALLELDDRAKMEKFIKEHESASQLPIPPIKNDETVFEYMVRYFMLASKKKSILTIEDLHSFKLEKIYCILKQTNYI